MMYIFIVPFSIWIKEAVISELFLAHAVTCFCIVTSDCWLSKMYAVISANEMELITAFQLSDRCWVTWYFK